jgi:hypothetical protein
MTKQNASQAEGHVRHVVGFAGAMHSGKTTAALELVRLGFVRVRFAGPLKNMLHVLGLTPAQLDGDEKEKPSALLGGVTPRHAMQTLGTEWGRQCIHPDLWINAWMNGLKIHKQPIVADDLRYQNEVDAIHAVGGVVVQIERDGIGSDLNIHASEQLAFDSVDHVIRNNGSIGQFQEQIRYLARGLTEQPRAA